MTGVLEASHEKMFSRYLLLNVHPSARVVSRYYATMEGHAVSKDPMMNYNKIIFPQICALVK